MPKTTVQINSVLVCEDIRREDSGKSFFIGVYSGDILASKAPANLVFSFWFDCYTKEHVNKFEAKIVLINKFDNSSVELFNSINEHVINSDIPVDKGAPFNIALIGLPLHVEQESILVVSSRPVNGKWKELSRKNIILPKDSTEIAQP